ARSRAGGGRAAGRARPRPSSGRRLRGPRARRGPRAARRWRGTRGRSSGRRARGRGRCGARGRDRSPRPSGPPGRCVLGIPPAYPSPAATSWPLTCTNGGNSVAFDIRWRHDVSGLPIDEYTRVSFDKKGNGKSVADQHMDNVDAAEELRIILGEWFDDGDRKATLGAKER